MNLFHCALGKVESQQLQHGGGSFDEPQQLELISPIKDTSLLRPAPLMPSRSPNMSRTATVPPSPGRSRSYAFTSGHSSSMSNGYHSRSSSISTSSMYDSANNVIDYMKVPLMQSPVLVGGQLNHPNLALAQQNVAHCAYQGFRNDRSGRIGQACSPSADYNLVLGTASPTAASAMHRGYDVATVPRYAATYSMPVASTSATLDYSYHANPDGTLVNTAQGVISVSESRAVVIRNLNHRASPEDVQVHFRPAGIIEHCDIGAPRNDKKKCTATITFRNAEEAKSAVRRFNGTKFQGRPISAEIAKDDSAIGRGRALSDVAATRTDELTVTRTVSRRKPGQGPLIVNGSDEGPVYEPATSSSQKSRGKEKDKGMSTLTIAASQQELIALQLRFPGRLQVRWKS